MQFFGFMSMMNYILFLNYIKMSNKMESMWISEKPIEQNNSHEAKWKRIDEEAERKKFSELGEQKVTQKVDDNKQVKELKKELFKDDDDEKNSEKDREVENFIRKECCEPIKNVNTIKPFKDLVNLIVKSAKEEFDKAQKSLRDHKLSVKALKKYINAKEVRNKVRLFTLPDEEKNKLTDKEKKQIEWLAKDRRIYELPAYKELIEKWWFIIPSDIRTSYDSAGQQPVRHLWVDYNVKAWTPVKSIYDWKVVQVGLDGWLWYKVVIEHEMKDKTWKITNFYSLYGHLGSTNLPKKNDKITKWAPIWVVWAPFSKENWNWEEHLHFQIMEKQDSPEWYSKDTKKEQIWNYDVLSAFGKEYKGE